MVVKSLRPLILLAVAASGCSGIPAGTLEFEGVQNFSVQKVQGDEVTLHITGFSAGSSVAISRIDTVIEGDNLTVLPKLVLVHGNLTGNLDLVLNVPANIHHVLFGLKRYEIWPNVPKPKSREDSLEILSKPVNKPIDLN